MVLLERWQSKLHLSYDANTVGYGQCFYLRFCSRDGNMQCALIMGISRVTPKNVPFPDSCLHLCHSKHHSYKGTGI